MDEYDPLRLPALRDGRLVLSLEDLAALAAAHPELSQDDIARLTRRSVEEPGR